MYPIVCFVCSIFIILSRESDGACYIWDESAHALELFISVFSGCFFDFLSLALLLVRSHQVEIIIVKRLIQGRNKVSDEGGS